MLRPEPPLIIQDNPSPIKLKIRKTDKINHNPQFQKISRNQAPVPMLPSLLPISLNPIGRLCAFLFLPFPSARSLPGGGQLPSFLRTRVKVSRFVRRAHSDCGKFFRDLIKLFFALLIAFFFLNFFFDYVVIIFLSVLTIMTIKYD